MRLLKYIFVSFLCVRPAACQEVRRADYKLRVEVVDEQGKPVSEARVHTSRLELESPPFMGKLKRNPVVLTNDQGIATIEYTSVHHESGAPSPGAFVDKDGWYASTTPKGSWPPESSISGNLYEASKKAILKPIKNPIPMLAKTMDQRIWINKMEAQFKYDLMEKSLVDSSRNGKHADFTITVTGDYKDMKNNNLKMDLVFTNPDDGLVGFSTPQRINMTDPSMEGSILISGYEAPSEGYVNHLTRRSIIEPGDLRKKTDSDLKRNYYFRIRTKRDESGNIISAYYGKIYGDFDFVSGNVSAKGNYASVKWIASYLNPTPNDRNVEFDPKRNLIPDGNVQRP